MINMFLRWENFGEEVCGFVLIYVVNKSWRVNEIMLEIVWI